VLIPIVKPDNNNEENKLFVGKKDYWPLVILLLIVTTFHFFTLSRAPAPHVDEAWNASRAWGFIQTGRNFGPLDAGVFDRYDGYWTFFPTLVTWIYSLGIRMLGPTLLSVRITSLIFGLILLLAVYSITDYLYGQKVGLLSVFLVALSNSFLFSAHLGRQDIIVAAIAYCAFALYITDKDLSYSYRSVLTGLAASLAFEVHPPIGLIVAPAIGLLYILDFGFSFVRIKRFLGFISGVMIGFAFYAILHIIPYPQTYITLATILTPWRMPPVLTLDPTLWLKSLMDLILLIIQFERLWLPILTFAIVTLLLRRLKSDIRLLKLIIVVCATLIMLIRFKLSFYAIIITPLASILIASVLPILGHFLKSKTTNLDNFWRIGLGISLALVFCYIGFAIAFDLSPILINHESDFEEVVTSIHQLIPEGSIVMGPQTYWFGMVGQPYYTWEQLVFYQRYAPGTTLENAFAQFRPQFFILDKHLESFIANDVSDLSEYHQFLFISNEELQRFLNSRASLISVLNTVTFGSILVYRISWP
jgi:4-amino-4-deoxy-L-arabinose transferase-like glycosyltransferase